MKKLIEMYKRMAESEQRFSADDARQLIAEIECLEAENERLKQESNTWKERAEGIGEAYDCEKEEREHLEAKLAELKALHVTDMVVAMQKVCETTQELIDHIIPLVEHTAYIPPQYLDAVQQALLAWVETKKGEKR